MRNTKKAFTLVELIVVITILAILGTIGFISLQGFSGEARDSARLSEVNELLKKMTIENAKGTSYEDLVTVVTNETKTINNTGTTVGNGRINFVGLKESQTSFQDKISGVPYDYKVGIYTGSTAGTLVQLSTFNETNNVVKVVGNYFKANTATDSDGLIGTGSGLVDGAAYVNPAQVYYTAN